MKSKKLLTKSKYMVGLQCLKSLWYEVNRKDLLPETDIQTQHRFDEGHVVGELAKQLYPKGINIPESNFKELSKLTNMLNRKVLKLQRNISNNAKTYRRV